MRVCNVYYESVTRNYRNINTDFKPEMIIKTVCRALSYLRFYLNYFLTNKFICCLLLAAKFKMNDFVTSSSVTPGAYKTEIK